MLKHVIALSPHEVQNLVPKDGHAVIAITDPGQSSPLKYGWGAALHESFTDPSKGHAVLTTAQAARIRWFIDSVHVRLPIDTLYVHCDAGGSRSNAIARYVADRYHLALPPTKAYSQHTYATLREIEAMPAGVGSTDAAESAPIEAIFSSDAHRHAHKAKAGS